MQDRTEDKGLKSQGVGMADCDGGLQLPPVTGPTGRT